MECEQYRTANFVDPAPASRFDFESVGGAVLTYTDFDAAVSFCTEVLGPPEYVEGPATRGWRIGSSWLTLLHGGSSAPANTEIPILMASPQEAVRLHAAFLEAGASGAEPADQLMYDPVRVCPATDPFGTELMIFARLTDASVNRRQPPGQSPRS